MLRFLYHFYCKFRKDSYHMKKFILLLPGLLCPYILLILMFCFFIINSSFIGENLPVVLLSFAALIVISIICSLIYVVLGLCRKWDSRETAFISLLIKVLQIPSYVLIFGIGCIFILTIFTYAISFILVIFDCLTIFITGLTGLLSVTRCYRDGKLTKLFAFVCGFCQFIFCIDVISAAVVYVKARSKSKPELSQTID